MPGRRQTDIFWIPVALSWEYFNRNYQKQSIEIQLTMWKKSWEKFLQNNPWRVSKKRNFALISKMCRSLEFSKKEKIFYKKNCFFRHNFAKKNVFLRNNLWEFLDARDLHIFEISVKFRFFWYPELPILQKYFSNSYKGL